ncbi:MAG: TIGR03086 family metal-binding protein [Acidimicrobiales bacterium]
MRDLVVVLAEPNRRRLLELLLEGEKSVSELSATFDVTRSAVSQHLGVLARAGLVQVRREGRFRYYRADPAGLAELRTSLDVFWTRELDELAAARPPRQGDDSMTVEKSVVVPLAADETFALLTEPERLRRWHTITARIDLRAGGDYRWTVVPGHTAAGTVIEVEPGRRLVMSWGWEGTEDLPPGASTLTITLEPVDGGTLVRLVHDGLTEEQAAGHGEGWGHYLDRLSLAARSGDAGADAWVFDQTPTDRLSAAEGSLAACQLVLRGLKARDGTLPTPCAKFTVDDLVDHLLESISHLGSMAGARVVPTNGSPEVRVATAAQQALEAWRRRGIDGEVQFGSSQLPASLAADILSVEFLVHAWDFATASSQQVTASDGLSDYVLGLAHELIAPQMRDGDRFGAEVEVGPDADNLTRLVAFTGRTP